MSNRLAHFAIATTALVGFAPALSGAAEKLFGAALYVRYHCAVCHGGFGSGGFGPRLAANPMLAVTDYVIAQILIGRGRMPAFQSQLSNAQIAALAQYIRNSWGNADGPVLAKDVASTRVLMESAVANAARSLETRK